jgi:hypothetical protein
MVNHASRQSTNKQTVTNELAESIALNLVRFLAQDGDRMARFLGLSGMDLAMVKESLARADQSFLGSVLDYALSDEPLLLQFATDENLDPLTILKARTKLPGANLDF